MQAIRVRLVDAGLSPRLLGENRRGHLRTLTRLGLPALCSSSTQDWRPLECAICVAIDPAGKVVGGVRLQRHLPERPMPCAEALRSIEGFDQLLANDIANGGCGECCGLWVEPAYAGYALGDILMVAALSQTRRWTGSILWGISPLRMVPRYLDLGYQTCAELGDQGAFWYAPVSDDAWVLRVPTSELESSAGPTAALRKQLRETGRGRGTTVGPRGVLDIHYDLDIPELACAL